MNGIDPYEYMNQLSKNLNDIEEPQRLAEILDKLEYLFEVVPPEYRELAEDLVTKVKQKLEILDP